MGTLTWVFAILFGYGGLTLASGIFPRMFGGGGQLSFAQQEKARFESDHKLPRNTVMGRVESWLYQARADISVGEFVLVSSMLGGGIGAIFLIATRAFMVACGAFFLGFILYYVFLLSRRENNALEYEKVQPQVVSTLYMTFKTKGVNLDGVLAQIAEKGPVIVREDWRTIRSSLTGTSFNIQTINDLLNKRASPALTAIVDILITYRNQVNEIPDILNTMREEIAQDVDDTTAALSALKGPRQEMGIVALVPIAIVLFYISGGMGDFYGTAAGQALILAAWAFTAVVYFAVNQRVRKAVNPRTVSFTIPEARSEGARTIARPERQVKEMFDSRRDGQE
ncbi:MAG: hypothetical protein PVI99_01255 [Anaerolineales bacterium]|jgi:hypothetical protein